MARTKQTARKCLINQAPRKMLVAQKIARKTGPIKTKNIKKGKKSSLQNPFQLAQSESENNEPEVNNQQFSLKFDDQAKCQEQAIDAKIIQCSNCQAILTSSSKVISKNEYKKLSQDPKLSDEKKQKFLRKFDQVWICEFCLNHNAIPKTYKIPQNENPCFLIQKVTKKKSKKGEEIEVQGTDKILIFCIDISGSMEMKVHFTKSRLDTVKEALIDEINRMNFEKEVIKVGLVTFGSMVTLIGDGKHFKQKTLGSQLYYDFDKIVAEAAKVKKFAQPITKSHNVLKNRIQNLGVYGSTALGPALLASIEIASKGGIGSKVIICTDGQANVGIGSAFSGFFNLTNSPSQKIQQFYEKAASFAKNKRVQVSILSLKGDNCNLKHLGQLSLATGGSILKIQPTSLGTEFSKIAKQQILGADSQLSIKVNKIFQIISHIPNQLSPDKTTLTQKFGNFSDQTELTFQFKILTKQQAALKPGVDLELFNQPRLPMQVQLTYIGRNGNKYKQVITDWRIPTENQSQVYEGANFGLFAASVLQRASSKIKSKEFGQAEKIIKGYWSIVNESFSKTQKQSELKKFGDRIKKVESVLKSKMRKSTGQKRQRSRSNIKMKKAPVLKSAGKTGKKQAKIQSESERAMSSDQEEQILCKQMRARSRSNSPAQKSKTKSKSKRI